MKTIYTPILILFLLTACNGNSNSYDFSEHSKLAEGGVSGTEVDVSDLILKPVNQTDLEDETIAKLQKQLDENKRQRSLDLLNKYSTPEERIEIEKVQLHVVDDESFQVFVTTVNESSRVQNTLNFNSVEMLENNLIKFELGSGQNDQNVKIRGYCLDKQESVCSNIVVEVSYPLNSRTVVDQFSFAKPAAPSSETSVSDETAIEKDSVDVEVTEALEKVDVQTNTEELKSPDFQESSRATGFESKNDKTVDLAKNQPQLVEPSDDALSELPNVGESSTSFKPLAETEQISSSDQTASEDQAAAIEEALASVALDDAVAEETSGETENDEGLKSSLRPKARPVDLGGKAHDSAVATSIRPRARPQAKDIEIISGEQIVDGEDTALAPGVYILPEDETESDAIHFRDLGVEARSYSDLDQDFNAQNGEFKYQPLLSSLKVKNYNQSKGGYGGKLGRGWIENSSALTNPESDSVEPRVSNRKYGSGLTIDFLKWLGKEYLNKYRNDSICVNHISGERGGEIGHRSHENGLDIDMSIPSSAVDCKRKGLKDYRSYYKEDRDFFKKNYDLLKMMISSGKVHVVFVDKSFISKMCTYTKSLNLSADEVEVRKEVFNRLYHVGGHANHFHVRMTCNEQNLGCKSQGKLPVNVKTDCD